MIHSQKLGLSLRCHSTIAMRLKIISRDSHVWRIQLRLHVTRFKIVSIALAVSAHILFQPFQYQSVLRSSYRSGLSVPLADSVLHGAPTSRFAIRSHSWRSSLFSPLYGSSLVQLSLVLLWSQLRSFSTETRRHTSLIWMRPSRMRPRLLQWLRYPA